jgi:hypothetical protein
VAGWVADAVSGTPTLTGRKFLFIGDSYGVGVNSGGYHGWPYYTALNLGFDNSESGGLYWSGNYTDKKGESKGGAARYVNVDPNWNQWIAIAQSGTGFAGNSTHVPQYAKEDETNEHDPGKNYSFATLMDKS